MLTSKSSLLVGLLLTVIMAWWMRGWWNPGLPLTPREENIPQLTDIWSLKTAADQGLLWTDWNPLANTGAPNIIQRSYPIFAPLAQLSASTHISVDPIYKVSALIAFTLSGLGMYLLLTSLQLKPASSFIGALAYMLSPPHIALASDLLDFNVFWAVIPWTILCLEKFMITRQHIMYASLVGILATLGLVAGNTYFVTTLPFFSAYALLRLAIVRIPFKSMCKLILLALSFFITTSAVFSLPIAIELPYTWLSQESTRQQIIDLPKVSDIFRSFVLRWQNHSPLAWEFNTRYPDLSWYLGTITLLLAAVSLVELKVNWKQLMPGIIITLGFVPFFAIMRSSELKLIVLKIINLFPNLQSVFDRTYRLFILPSLFLAIFAAFGTNILLKRLDKWRRFAFLLITALILIDLTPLSAYFFSDDRNYLIPSPQIISLLNSDSPGRYWSPFTFVPHLPKYRLEYANSFIYRPRVNNEYSYSALAPRYSSQLYETDLFGALEAKRQSIETVSRLLNWGEVKYILFSKHLFNYESILPGMDLLGWSQLVSDPNFILLQNTKHHGPISLEPEGSGEVIAWYRRQAGNISAVVSLTKTSTIIASESWYPGWQVSIDSRPAQLTRAHTAHLGVSVPSGNHLVEFSYKQPWYYVLGKTVSTISALLVLVIIANYVFTTRNKTLLSRP